MTVVSTAITALCLWGKAYNSRKIVKRKGISSNNPPPRVINTEAELAKEKTNVYKLDRAHIFSVNIFYEIEKLMRVPGEWAPPESKPYTSGENLQHWLIDEKGRDQFVIRGGSDTEVLWNDAKQVKANPVYKRPVKLIDFPPGEKYLVTYSRHEPTNPRDSHVRRFIIGLNA
ncbi:hypothetical protein L2E82_04773 [Cichorium intybus]|uniref:Uncharacterized protein n=1 Tax=Cichorium intybus TaxID=13427 RepID=A0ACB9H611_CICIN|nr:hypothetical protein L2E82_04773 [Cichorium intybus]